MIPRSLADIEAAAMPIPREMAIAQAVRQACVNAYSPDISAHDWSDAMGDIDLADVIRRAVCWCPDPAAVSQARPIDSFLLSGARFKMNFNGAGNATNFQGYESHLQGQWVALVNAENGCHLAAAPAVAGIRSAVLEEAASLCESDLEYEIGRRCASAIRALKEAK